MHILILVIFGRIVQFHEWIEVAIWPLRVEGVLLPGVALAITDVDGLGVKQAKVGSNHRRIEHLWLFIIISLSGSPLVLSDWSQIFVDLIDIVLPIYLNFY